MQIPNSEQFFRLYLGRSAVTDFVNFRSEFLSHETSGSLDALVSLASVGALKVSSDVHHDVVLFSRFDFSRISLIIKGLNHETKHTNSFL